MVAGDPDPGAADDLSRTPHQQGAVDVAKHRQPLRAAADHRDQPVAGGDPEALVAEVNGDLGAVAS